MRCYQFTDSISLDALRLVERPDPSPSRHEIVLRIRAAGLNFRDLAMMRGSYHINVSPPLVPLSDGAGEVVEVGSAVTRFRNGDLACPTYLPDWQDGPLRADRIRRRLGGPTDGVLAEFMCIHEDEAVRCPPYLDAVEAAALPVAAPTAWRTLQRYAGLAPGEIALIQGSGGVSTAAIQLAVAGGARVISVVREATHSDVLKALGAEAVLVTSDPNGVAELLRAHTGGEGATVALNVAGANTVTGMVAATKLGGVVCLVGFAASPNAEIDLFEAIRHGTTFHTGTAGSREDFEKYLSMMSTSRLHPAIARRFPLSALADAVDFLATGRPAGKVVINVDFSSQS
jgi:NADPH:quinone reductase-like Zn-dependent oxidoreductase